MWSRYDDALYDRTAADRHDARLEEAKRRNEEIDRVESEKAAAERAEADRRTRRQNAVMQLREYRHAGVEPPKVDDEGYPTTSLETLLSLGWRIEQARDGNVLVPPRRQ